MVGGVQDEASFQESEGLRWSGGGWDGAADAVAAQTVSGVVTRRPVPGSGRVADRVRALKEQTRHEEGRTMNPTISRKPVGQQQQVAVPTIYPLHVNKFVRRSGSAAPMRPETPIYQSQPDPRSRIHAPKPTKAIAVLDRQSPVLDRSPRGYQMPSPEPDLVTTPEASQKNPKAARFTSPYTRNDNFALSPTAAYLSGTTDKCMRHGRKRASKPTTDGLARGRTGAYYPTGLSERRQYEATSLYVAMPGLIGAAGPTDACPDCRQELSIRRREAMQTVMRPMDRVTLVSRPSPEPEQARSLNAAVMSVSATRDPHRSKQRGLVALEDLGDGLNAAVYQHAGRLDRVIIDKSMSRPVAETLQILSNDLMAVAHALSVASIERRQAANGRTRGERAAPIVARSPEPEIKYSVEELMGVVDEAAAAMSSRRGDNGSGSSPVPTRQQVRQRLARPHQDTKSAASTAPAPPKTTQHRATAAQDAAAPTSTKVTSTSIPTILTRKPSIPTSPTVSKPPPCPATTQEPSPKLFATPHLPISADTTPVQDTSAVAAKSPSAFDTFPTSILPLERPASQATDPLPAICSNPTPYHHAPREPANLLVAAWADKGVKEAVRGIKLGRADVRVAGEEAGRAAKGSGQEGRHKWLGGSWRLWPGSRGPSPAGSGVG